MSSIKQSLLSRKTILLFVLIAVLLILFQLSFSIHSVAVESDSTLVAEIDIGNPLDESEFDLFGWGPVCLDSSKPNGPPAENYRVVWYNDSENPSSIPTNSPDENFATIQMFTGENAFAKRLKLYVFDGKSDDSFQVYVNDNLVYTDIDDGKGPKEKWRLHNIDVLNLELTGLLTIKIVATGEKSKDFDSEGQLAVSWIQLFAMEFELTKVSFNDSNSNPISGGIVQYYDGEWKEFGITNETGKASKYLPDETYTFKMTYEGAYVTKKQDITNNKNVSFSTINVTIKLENSTGIGLADGIAQFNADGWKDFGITNSDGCVSKELLAKRYTFKMTYLGGAIGKRQDVSTNSTVIFSTIKVTVHFKDSQNNSLSNGFVEYAAGGWKYFGITDETGNATKELIARPYTFRMNYEGASLNKRQDLRNDPIVNFSTIQVNVKFFDSNQKPIQDGVVEYAAGGWKEFGITDENGTTTKEMLPRIYNFKLTYLGTYDRIRQDVSINSTVIFSTINVTVKFQDSMTNPISDGVITYNSGGWKDFGTTDENGTAFKEVLAKNYYFKLSYDGTYVRKRQDTSINSTVIFSTVNATVRLINSLGDPLNGGIVTYNSGGWKDFGITNESGNATKELLPRRYSFRMEYEEVIAGQRQDVSSNSVVIFSTVGVTVRLENDTGGPLNQGIVSYSYRGWKDFGITNESGNATKEMLPRTYTFKMTYDGTYLRKRQNIAENSVLIFSTVNVTVKFQDSNGNLIPGANISYYSGGWKNLGITNESVALHLDLLPKRYTFSMLYDGITVRKKQDISVDSVVVFSTVNATVRLQDSKGNSIAGGVAEYYYRGWREIGTTGPDGNVTIELIPRRYTFKMSYLGTYDRIRQDVSINSTVIFSTINVTVKFQDSLANPISDGVITYNSGGWKDFGTTDENGTAFKEVLAKNYYFKLSYDGTYVRKRQDTSINSTVIFSTVNVTVKFQDSLGRPISEGVVKYNSGGWKDFGTTDENGTVNKELLSRRYNFRMIWDGTYVYKRQDVSINSTVIFSTINATIRLEDSIENPLSGGIATYYSAGWKDVGTTDSNGEAKKELLPRKYTFRMVYKDLLNERIRQDLSVDSIVLFKTSTIENYPPVANAGGPYSALIHKEIEFNGSRSYDMDGEIINWTWGFGDGNFGFGEKVNHSYSTDGNFTVTLFVKDDFGTLTNDTTYANISLPIPVVLPEIIEESEDNGNTGGSSNNLVFKYVTKDSKDKENKPPKAVVFDAPTTAIEGNNVVFDASKSSDEDGEIVSYLWDFGNGETSTDVSPMHSFKESGEKLVSLTVVDDSGAKDTIQFVINVQGFIGEGTNVENTVRSDSPYNLVFCWLLALSIIASLVGLNYKKDVVVKRIKSIKKLP